MADLTLSPTAKEPDIWKCSSCGNTNPASEANCLGCGSTVFEAKSPMVEVGKHEFNQSDYQTLQFSALWVFSMMAGVDGKIDEEEFGKLIQILQEAHLFHHFLPREIFGSVARDFETVWPAYGDDSRNLEDAFDQVSRILDSTLDPEESQSFKLSLLAIAKEIAEASGGGFLGIGDKVSDEEKMAFGFIAMKLGLEPEDFR